MCVARHSADPPISPRKSRRFRRTQPHWICVARHSAGPCNSPRKWRQFRRSQPHRDGEAESESA
eukprot:2048755-Pyramimonas_sp.AAC.1